MGVKVKLELFGHDIQSPRRKDRVVTYNVIARPVTQARFSIPTPPTLAWYIQPILLYCKRQIQHIRCPQKKCQCAAVDDYSNP